MANFCGQCGNRLDKKTGLCPECDKGKIFRRKLIFPMILFLMLTIMAVLIISERVDSIPTKGIAVPETAVIPQWPQVDLVTDIYFEDSYIGTDWDNFSPAGRPIYFHIPQINLNLPGIQAINEKIYQDLFHGVLEDSVFSWPEPCMGDLAYTVAEKEDIISILVCIYDRFSAEYFDDHQYIVYNVNRQTGEYVTDEELLAAYGWGLAAYQNWRQNAVSERSLEINKGSSEWEGMEDYYLNCLEETMSQENLNKAQLFIDTKSGDLCMTVRIYRIDGIVSEEVTLNLTGTAQPVDPAKYRDITVQWGDPVNQANIFGEQDFPQIWTIRYEINGYHFLSSYLFQDDRNVYCATGLEYSEITSFEAGTYEWKDNVILFSMNNRGNMEEYAYAYDAEKKLLTQVSDDSLYATHEKGTVLRISDQEGVTMETFEYLIKYGLGEI